MQEGSSPDNCSLLRQQAPICVFFPQGWFNETLPAAPVERIAFLRLDGDLWVPSSAWPWAVSVSVLVLGVTAQRASCNGRLVPCHGS